MFGDHNGDVSCNSYELWDQDLGCIRQLGLTHYRLSVSWARLLPEGTTARVNHKGERPRDAFKDQTVARSFGAPDPFPSLLQGCSTTTG